MLQYYEAVFWEFNREIVLQLKNCKTISLPNIFLLQPHMEFLRGLRKQVTILWSCILRV